MRITEFVKKQQKKVEKGKSWVDTMTGIKLPDIKLPTIKAPKISDSELNKWIGKEREPIPPATRKKVWENRFGNRSSGLCYCCKERTIYKDAFHCAHRRAVARGGSNRSSNLEPVCQRCNLTMGTQDFLVYQRQNFPKAVKKTTASKKNISSKKGKSKSKTTKKTSSRSSKDYNKELEKSMDKLDRDINRMFKFKKKYFL